MRALAPLALGVFIAAWWFAPAGARAQQPGPGAIEGVVRLPDGGPAAGVRVKVWSQRGGMTEATSDDEGRFEVDGLPGGLAVVEVWPDGPPVLEFVDVPQAGDAVRVEVTVTRGYAARGRIGTVDGKPMPGAAVERVNRISGETLGRAVADAEGRYRFEDLPRGAHHIRIVAADKLVLQSEDQLEAGIAWEPSFTFVPGPAATIAGRLTLPPGASRDPNGPPFAIEVGPRVVTHVATPEYRVEGLPPGPTEVRASLGDGLIGVAILDLAPGETRRVDLALAPAASIAGVVVDAQGKPMARADVDAWPIVHDVERGPFEDLNGRNSALQPWSRKTVTATDGTFILRFGRCGAYRITAWARLAHPGLPSLAREVVTLAPSEERRGLRLTLAPRVRVSGRVEGGATGSAGIYAVRLVDGARWENADRVQKDGAFAIRELHQGPACFIVRRQTFHDKYGGYPQFCSDRYWPSATGLAGRLDVVVGPDTPLTTLVIPLEPAGTITGRLRRPAGAQEFKVSAILTTPRGDLLIHSTFAEDDSVRLDDLPRGRYVVEATAFEPAPFSGASRRMLIERKVVEVAPGAVCEVGDLTPR